MINLIEDKRILGFLKVLAYFCLLLPLIIGFNMSKLPTLLGTVFILIASVFDLKLVAGFKKEGENKITSCFDNNNNIQHLDNYPCNKHPNFDYLFVAGLFLTIMRSVELFLNLKNKNDDIEESNDKKMFKKMLKGVTGIGFVFLLLVVSQQYNIDLYNPMIIGIVVVLLGIVLNIFTNINIENESLLFLIITEFLTFMTYVNNKNIHWTGTNNKIDINKINLDIDINDLTNVAKNVVNKTSQAVEKAAQGASQAVEDVAQGATKLVDDVTNPTPVETPSQVDSLPQVGGYVFRGFNGLI
tara:strand:- start:3222 stop:4118 length:897 start_codon:yes stop_codon:yes gene_type:complete